MAAKIGAAGAEGGTADPLGPVFCRRDPSRAAARDEAADRAVGRLVAKPAIRENSLRGLRRMPARTPVLLQMLLPHGLG